MEQIYSPKARTDRLIALARLALASFSLWAVWLDPTEPAGYGRFVQGLMAAYAVYSAMMLAVVWRASAPLKRPIIAHLVDLVVLCVFQFASSGANSPLFPFFTFALAAASLRWQRRGTLWTAAVLVAVFAATGLYALLARGTGFELNLFIIRLVSLAVTAALLGELGAYATRVHEEINKLAVVAPEVGEKAPDAVARLLPRWAADVLGAGRVVIAWEDGDEPWLYLTWWEGGEGQYAEEPPGVMDPLVAKELAAVAFLCRRAYAPIEPVLHTSPDGFKRWQGEPLHPALRQRFSVGSVISAGFEIDTLRGRVFFLDKRDMTTDDLVLGEIVTRHVANRLAHAHLVRRLSERAALEERTRLSRDLHDGALQALAGVALDLEALLRRPDLELAGARDQLREIQDGLETEQRTLRMLIRMRKPSRLGAPEPALRLSDRLTGLVERLERQWNFEVESSLAGLKAVPYRLADDICLLVQEALVNAARHAGGSRGKLVVTVADGRVTIVVSDNGRGFPFKGRYDHSTLAAQRLGPVTLRERAAALGGSLTLESTEAGARLEISLPLGAPGR
jgi:signal transduction histidine kinase